MSSKYDEAADRFTEAEYADPGRYFSHRADILVSLGPRLVPGDRVLDLACADASFAEPLLARGLDYVGVDVSEPMVEVGRRRLGGRGELIAGDALAYVPPEPVAATTIFRSLHFVGDRVAFFRHVASFTEKKLVFDVAPRLEPLGKLRSQLGEAGWDRVETRPFFVPQNVHVPLPLRLALTVAERVPPLAALLLRYRFAVLVAAYRSAL